MTRTPREEKVILYLKGFCATCVCHPEGGGAELCPAPQLPPTEGSTPHGQESAHTASIIAVVRRFLGRPQPLMQHRDSRRAPSE
jgi:hypothetical protein